MIEDFSQYRNKWTSLEYEMMEKNSLYKMKEILKEIIRFLTDFEYFNYIIDFLQKCDNELSELIPIIDMSNWNSDGRHNSEDIYKEINTVYTKVLNCLFNEISEEKMKNAIRKNNLDKIL